jgi:transposase-like protein
MPITGRPKKALVLTDDEQQTLIRLTQRARVNRSLAFRARLVLACADGTLNSAVARRYRTTNATVGKWRQRFIDRRLEGIYDEPRAGAPRTITRTSRR